MSRKKKQRNIELLDEEQEQEEELDLFDDNEDDDDDSFIVNVETKKQKKERLKREKNRKELVFEDIQLSEGDSDWLDDGDDFIIDISEDNKLGIFIDKVTVLTDSVGNFIRSRVAIRVANLKEKQEQKKTIPVEDIKTRQEQEKQTIQKIKEKPTKKKKEKKAKTVEPTITLSEDRVQKQDSVDIPQKVDVVQETSINVEPTKDTTQVVKAKPKKKAKRKRSKDQQKLDVVRKETVTTYINVVKAIEFGIKLGEDEIGKLEVIRGYHNDIWIRNFEIEDRYSRLKSKILVSFIARFRSKENRVILVKKEKAYKTLGLQTYKFGDKDFLYYLVDEKFAINTLEYLEPQEEDLEDFEDFVEEETTNDFNDSELNKDLKLWDISKKTYNIGRIVVAASLALSIIGSTLYIVQKNSAILEQYKSITSLSKSQGAVAWVNNFLNKSYANCDKLVNDNDELYVIPYNLYSYGAEDNYYALLNSIVDNIGDNYTVDYDDKTNTCQVSLTVKTAKEIEHIEINKDLKKKILDLRNKYIKEEIKDDEFKKELNAIYKGILNEQVLQYTDEEFVVTYSIKEKITDKGKMYVESTDDMLNDLFESTGIKNNLQLYENETKEKIGELIKEGM